MAGSSVGRATGSAVAEDRLADVVAHMRAWALAAQAAAMTLGQADASHAARLGESR